jgi:hypothetical protein
MRDIPFQGENNEFLIDCNRFVAAAHFGEANGRNRCTAEVQAEKVGAPDRTAGLEDGPLLNGRNGEKS